MNASTSRTLTRDLRERERGMYTSMVDRIGIWKRLEAIGVVLHASGTAETSCLEQDSHGR